MMSFRVLVWASIFISSLGLAPQAFAEERSLSFKTFDGLELNGILSEPSASARGLLLILPGSGNTDADGDLSSLFIGFPQGGKSSAKLSQQLAKALDEARFYR